MVWEVIIFMKINNLCVKKKSQIHGLGLFAAKDIPKNIDIIQYTGKLVLKREGTKRSKQQEKEGTVYIFFFNNKYDIDGKDGGKGAQFINHSCKPNCESILYNDEEIWIKSIKKIKKGEELTYDYGFKDDKLSCD